MNSKSSKSSKSCTRGKILRKGYRTVTGKRVNPSCINATSASGKKTSDILKRYIKSKDSMHRAASKKFSKEAEKKCAPGYIKREGYKVGSHKSHSKSGKKTSVKSTWVAPACIRSQTGKNSSKNKSKVIVIMERDVLAKYGYDKIKGLSPKERKSALKNAIRDIKPLSVYRRLVALSTLNKNKDVDLYKILKEDAEWIKSQVEYIIQKASNSKSSKRSSKKNSKISSKKNSKISSKKNSKISSKKSSKRSSKKSSIKSQKGGESIGAFIDVSIPVNINPNNKTHDASIRGNFMKKKLDSKDRNKLFYYKN
jgi:hypothetical protein